MKKLLLTLAIGIIFVISGCANTTSESKYIEEVRQYFENWSSEEMAAWNAAITKNFALLNEVGELHFQFYMPELTDFIQEEFDDFARVFTDVQELRATFLEAMMEMEIQAIALERIMEQLLIAKELSTYYQPAPRYNDFFGSYLKRIGNYNFGFMEIPENWIPFVDASGVQGLLQYTDVGWNIITLSFGDVQDMNFEEFANYHMNIVGGDIVSTVEPIQLANVGTGYTYTTNIGGKYLTTIIIKRPASISGNLQIITIEGSRAEVEELTRLVEQTFRFSR